MRVAWTVRRSNQSILKEINLEHSLEGLMLKLQHFGYLMQRANSLEKTLMLGKIEGKRRRGRQRDDMVGWHHQLNGLEFEQTQGDSEGQVINRHLNPQLPSNSALVEGGFALFSRSVCPSLACTLWHPFCFAWF